MIEWLALITMSLDHIGFTFFPDNSLWRMIGRIAFPLYAFLMINGLQRTRNKQKYLKRLLLIACISQVPYYLLFEIPRLNVVFTLLFSAFALYEYEKVDRNQYNKIFVPICIGCLIAMFSSNMDYGLYGFFLCLVYYWFKSKPLFILILHVLLNVGHAFLYDGHLLDLQAFSLMGSMIICLYQFLPLLQIQRSFFRSFYPLHLVILIIIKNI